MKSKLQLKLEEAKRKKEEALKNAPPPPPVVAEAAAVVEQSKGKVAIYVPTISSYICTHF